MKGSIMVVDLEVETRKAAVEGVLFSSDRPSLAALKETDDAKEDEESGSVIRCPNDVATGGLKLVSVRKAASEEGDEASKPEERLGASVGTGSLLLKAEEGRSVQRTECTTSITIKKSRLRSVRIFEDVTYYEVSKKRDQDNKRKSKPANGR